MLKKTLTALSVSLMTAAAFAGAPAPQAAPQTIEPTLISYNNVFLEYSFLTADVGPFEADAHGLNVGVEFSPIEHLYLAGRGGWSNIDVAGLDFDYWTLNAGIGGYLAIAENIHFVTEVGASYADISLTAFPGFGGDDFGVYVTPHFRAKFGAFEAHAGVTYNSNDLAPSEWTGFARLLYEVAPQLDLYVGGVIGFDDSNNGFQDLYGVQAGIRFKF